VSADADTLYQTTTVAEMRRWLLDLGEVQRAQNHDLTDWEVEFVESVRGQFNERLARGAQKPLSGKQLVQLKTIWDEKA
jgi:hypothetical protein